MNTFETEMLVMYSISGNCSLDCSNKKKSWFKKKKSPAKK